eukprot:s1013_g14.t1
MTCTTFEKLSLETRRMSGSSLQSYCVIHPSSSLNDAKFQYDSKWVKIEVPTSDSSGDPYLEEQSLAQGAAEEDVIYFDNVFAPNTSQDHIFRDVAHTHVRAALTHFRSAMFIASGATGSGKTFAITGGAQSWEDALLLIKAPLSGSGFAAMVASGARTFAPKASRFAGSLGCPEPRHPRGHSEILCASGARLAELGEAKWLVQCACRQQSAMCVEPTPSELRQWWEELYHFDAAVQGVQKFQPSSVTQALEHQVQAGWDGGAPDWRPQFRGLHLLHFMRQQSGEPGAAAHAVVCKLHPLLHFLLAEVPQFATIATRLLFFEPASTSLEDEVIHCLPAIGPRFREEKPTRLAVDEPIASERGLEGLAAEKNETHSQTSTDTAGEFERILADLESDSQPEVEMPLPYIPRSPAPFRSGQFWAHSDRGLIPRSVTALFEALASIPDKEDVEISVSFYELYKDAVIDLLSERRRKVPIRASEGGPVLVGLLRQVVANQTDALHLLFQGDSNRHFQNCALNSESSRGPALSSRTHSTLLTNILDTLPGSGFLGGGSLLDGSELALLWHDVVDNALAHSCPLE